ncbi:MAG: hypothetical protein WCD70_06940 [Alphaproteobacteria bacterium]
MAKVNAVVGSVYGSRQATKIGVADDDIVGQVLDNVEGKVAQMSLDAKWENGGT